MIDSVENEERIATLFADNLRVNAAAAEQQAAPIARAAETMVASLLGGGKILSCGNGGSAADAQYFAGQMQHRFQRDRSGLPALALGSNAATLTSIARSEGFSHIFANQIGTLGHPGDVLLLLCVNGTADNIVNAAAAAQDRHIPVVAVTGKDGGVVTEYLGANDTEIRAPADSAARILENHRLVLHCLCDLIDLQLMGGETV